MISKYTDRNRILLSLNRAAIEQWDREHGVPPMLDDDGNPVPDEIFFMAVHRLADRCRSSGGSFIV